jgi:hypothetical protein
VGKYRRHAVERAYGTPVKQLAVEPMGKSALLQRHQRQIGSARKRGQGYVRNPLAMPGSRQINVAFSDRSLARPGLIHQLQERAAKRYHIVQPLAHQQPSARIKKLLCGRIDEKYLAIRSYQKDRHWQCRNDQRGGVLAVNIEDSPVSQQELLTN